MGHVPQYIFNGVFKDYQRKAKAKGRDFTLTFAEFKSIITRHCIYCHAPPIQIRKGYSCYNGIDRKDNSKGYTLENSVPCCGKCNSLKSNLLTFEEAKAVLGYLKAFRQRVLGQE